MIIASISGPPGLGYVLGQTTFAQGKDFNCNASICYGIGAANHAQLQQLQTLINAFATLARFTPITVDGFIGAGTVNAGAQAAKVIIGQGAGGSSIITQLANGLTKDQIATNAPELIGALTDASNALAAQGAPVQAASPSAVEVPSPAPAVATAPTATDTGAFTKAVDFVKSFFQPSASPTPGGFAPAPGAPGAAPGTPGAAAAAAAPVKKTPTWVWIVAGVGGAIVVGGIGYALFHKPSAPPTPAPAARPAPAAAKAVGRRRARPRRRRRSAED